MDPNLNDKVKTILTTEVKFVIAVIGFVVGVVSPYYSMKQDVALIQKDISIINTNHEAHIQDILTEMKELKQTDIAQNDKIIQLQENIIRLSK
jgi:hypothetical protein